MLLYWDPVDHADQHARADINNTSSTLKGVMIFGTLLSLLPLVSSIPVVLPHENRELEPRGVQPDPAGYFEKYGYPAPVHDLLNHSAYVSLYDRSKRNPIWSIEQLTPESLGVKVANRHKSVFAEDTNIPVHFRARLKNYYRSGYDRGHQAPAADAEYSQEAMDQTFLLSNMCPQVGEGFNRNYWAYFEAFARNLTGEYSSVRVVTGPLYLPTKGDDGKWRVTYEVIGNPPTVAVPTHFFKVIVGEGTGQTAAVGAFILPNTEIDKSTKLTSFQVDISEIESAIGAEVMPKLPKEDRQDLCSQVKCEVIEW